MDDKHRYATEEERKIYPEPTIPVIAGTYSGSVRIVGGGASMWNDWKQSEALMNGTDIICVNMSGMVIPKATHLFSWHKKQLSAIKEWRMAEWPDCKAIVHSVEEHGWVNWAWRFNGGTSVSGLSCIDLAWLLGYRKIYLVGIPMDNKGYFYKPTDNPDMHDKYRHREVGKLKGIYGDAVKSFSGFTREVFGAPQGAI